jgi:hypothetical protein
MTSTKSRNHDLILALGLFSFLFGVYLLSYSGVFHSGDDVSFVDSAIELLRGSTKWPTHGGLFPLSLAAVLALTRGLRGIGPVQAMFLVNVSATALTAVFLFFLGRELRYAWKAALLVALLCGLATPIWFYSKVLFREGFIAMWLTAAALFSVRFGRRFSLLALGMALLCWCAALVTRVYCAVALAFGLAYICIRVLERRKTLVGASRIKWTVVATLLSVLAIAAVGIALWYYRSLFGEFIAQVRNWGPLASLLFSPARGLLLYAPVVLLAIAGFLPFARSHPQEAFLLYGSWLAYLLLISRHPDWEGGWSWGPRLLISFLPFMIFPINHLLQEVLIERRRTWLIVPIVVICLASVCMQVLAVTYGANMTAFMSATGGGWEWDPAYAPLVWPLSEFKRLTLDLAWPNLQGALANKVAVVMPAALIALLGVGILVRYRHAAPTTTRLSLITLAVFAGILGITGWTLHSYYLLDARYDPASGIRAALEQVRGESREGDVLVLDHRLLDDQHIARSRVYNGCGGGCPALVYFAREPWQNEPDEPDPQQIERIISEYRRVWLIPYRYPGGDPNSMVEHMLNYRTYEEKCEWTGPSIRLCLYRNEPPDGLTRQDQRVEAAFGNQISLRKTAIGWQASGAMDGQAIRVSPGETLYVDLLWTARASTDRNYKVSMQLLDSEGRLQHQLDREPVDGFRPTNTWSPGEGIPDKYAFVLPASLPPGNYQLVLAMYEPETQTRLETSTGDSFKIADVEVTSAAPPENGENNGS